MNDALGARGPADPRRWITLAIAVMATAIILIDNTVLTVAIPTILRDFHTDLPSLQWVITGYALTFATFLIIGGRLGDIFGHRRTFMVGTALFGTGSLLASLSTSVPTLIVGEAVVEGVGAALMLPATLAILSNTFEGHERPTAFAAWGAVAGAAGAFGPLLGGFLTTNYSWRWSFRINVIIAPVTIVGALVFMSQDAPRSEHLRVDVAGAAMVAVGTLLLVFGLSEGATYGWFRPVERVSIAGASLWPRRWPVSVIPVAFGAAAVLLWAFWVVERSKERRDAGPLFEFGQLRHRGFRYGLITVGIQSMGTFGLIFVLPVFLQNGKHLSAEDNGLWLFPLGMSLMIGSHIGGVLTRRIGATAVARTGLLLATTGLLYIALRLSPSTGFVDLLPGFLCYGTGAGFAASQLTNVILSDVPRDKAGVASGANSTGRQVGAALGVAVLGSLLSAETIRHAAAGIRHAPALPAGLRVQALSDLHAKGVNFAPPAGTPPAEVQVLDRVMRSALSAGARPALLFAASALAFASVLSLLIPRVSQVAPATATDHAGS